MAPAHRDQAAGHRDQAADHREPDFPADDPKVGFQALGLLDLAHPLHRCWGLGSPTLDHPDGLLVKAGAKALDALSLRGCRGRSLNRPDHGRSSVLRSRHPGYDYLIGRRRGQLDHGYPDVCRPSRRWIPGYPDVHPTTLQARDCSSARPSIRRDLCCLTGRRMGRPVPGSRNGRPLGRPTPDCPGVRPTIHLGHGCSTAQPADHKVRDRSIVHPLGQGRGHSALCRPGRATQGLDLPNVGPPVRDRDPWIPRSILRRDPGCRVPDGWKDLGRPNPSSIEGGLQADGPKACALQTMNRGRRLSVRGAVPARAPVHRRLPVCPWVGRPDPQGACCAPVHRSAAA